MSLCSRVLAVLCVLQLGCSSSDDSAPASSGDAPAPSYVLRVIDKVDVPLLPSGVEQLTVSYQGPDGRPVTDGTVEFGLLEAGPGASLSPTESRTDENGHAMTELRAGSTKSSFRVRASAAGADPVFFEVSVGDAVAPTVSVAIDYTGKRALASASVTLVAGMRCASISSSGAGNAGTSRVLLKPDQPDQSVDFPLGADVSYALLAWGRDDTNAKLAYGCTELTAPVTADAERAHLTRSIPIEDVQLDVVGSYAVTLSLDLEPALTSLASVATDAVAQALPDGATPEATFYLDAVQSALSSGADRDSFALQRGASAAGGMTLDQALKGLLDTAQRGPRAFAAELAALVLANGPTCSIQATYTDADADADSSFHVARLYALPNASLSATAKEVALDKSELSAEAVLKADYDQSRAQVVVDSLSLKLGLGSYANMLLDAAQADAQGFSERLAPVHGCSLVGGLVSARAGLPVASSAAVASCEQAVAGLLGRVRDAWAQLDKTRPFIWLTGELPVHDRDDDKQVDELGPADLTGRWGTQSERPGDPAVGATWRVPASAALAL